MYWLVRLAWALLTRLIGRYRLKLPVLEELVAGHIYHMKS